MCAQRFRDVIAERQAKPERQSANNVQKPPILIIIIFLRKPSVISSEGGDVVCVKIYHTHPERRPECTDYTRVQCVVLRACVEVDSILQKSELRGHTAAHKLPLYGSRCCAVWGLLR